jgi:GNAT superfamily N-acetyltransferase
MASAEIAPSTTLSSGVPFVSTYINDAKTASHATASVIDAARSMSQRASARENVRMAAVSQGLVEFANHFRQPPAPGIEVIDTGRYRLTLQPDYPIPGPNSAAWIRCRDDEADDVIAEVRELVGRRNLPLMWTLDPETQPAGFAEHLAAHGIEPEPHSPEVAVLVLAVDARIEGAEVEGLELRDALADPESFRQADAVNAGAFRDKPREPVAQERRRRNQLEAGNRRLLLATVDGEPAGSAGLTLYPPAGAIINGGAVLEKFRGRGVYRALVAARLEMARQAGLPGVSVWGGPMSRPILVRLGFEQVGWRRFYPDPALLRK